MSQSLNEEGVNYFCYSIGFVIDCAGVPDRARPLTAGLRSTTKITVRKIWTEWKFWKSGLFRNLIRMRRDGQVPFMVWRP